MKLIIYEQQEDTACLCYLEVRHKYLSTQNIELQQSQFGKTLYDNISKILIDLKFTILIHDKEVLSSDEIKYDGTNAVIIRKELGRYGQPYFSTSQFDEIVVIKYNNFYYE